MATLVNKSFLFLLTTVIFNNFSSLEEADLLDGIYETIEKGDLAGAVFEALEILKKTSNILPLVKRVKDKVKSTAYRNDGNNYYKAFKYQNALGCYNRALMFAPNGSEEMVLAFSNRSALLFRCNLYQACINDIETCLSLECSRSIKEKLLKRRNDAMNVLCVEKAALVARSHPFAEAFLVLKEKNAQIPALSADVGVEVRGGVSVVVALAPLPPGRLVCLETAMAAATNQLQLATQCDRCLKLALNLIPCDKCCDALFCSPECRLAAAAEYHRVLCPIVESIDHIKSRGLNQVWLRATIRARSAAGSWEAFEAATAGLGLDGAPPGPGETFTGTPTAREPAVYVHGRAYNAALASALILHYLDCVGYFPESRAREAFARSLLHAALFGVKTLSRSVQCVVGTAYTCFCPVGASCAFPVIGRLRHSCRPSALALGLGHRLALVTARPLKPGDELTVAYAGDWLEYGFYSTKRPTSWHLFVWAGITCDCEFCSCKQYHGDPTELEMRCLRDFNIRWYLENYNIKMIEEVYPKCCKALALLDDYPLTIAYKWVYTLYRKCLMDIQQCHTGNTILE